ncbi:hypothetical protein ACLOJK_024459 [Asimina triloba]
MEGCSPISPSDSLQLLHKLQSKGGGEDLQLRRLLDQILSAFFKEIRPLPPTVLGDGRSVDFFRLYWAVREKGGYDSVTANGSWGPVMEELGLGSTPGSSAKWIYVKYLDAFDRWLQRISKEIVVGDESAEGLESAIKGLLCGAGVWEEPGKDEVFMPGGSKGEGGERGPVRGARPFSETNDALMAVRENGVVEDIAGPASGGPLVRGLGFDMNELPAMPWENEDAGDDLSIGLASEAQEFSELCSAGSESETPATTAEGLGHAGWSSSSAAARPPPPPPPPPLSGADRFQQPAAGRNEVRGSLTVVGESATASTAANGDVDDEDDEDDEVVVLGSRFVSVEFNSLKRKRERECLMGMLDWLKRIAKDPCDRNFGMLVEEYVLMVPGNPSLARLPTIHEHWGRMLIARELLLQRRRPYSNVERSLLQMALGNYEKRQKMHPSMYEDSTNRLPLLRRPLSVSCLEASVTPSPQGNDYKFLVPHMTAPETDSNKRVLRTLGSLTAQKVVDLFCKDQIQKRIPIGPYFQAEIPEWTGVPSTDDSKWLGTQHWPQKVGGRRLKVGTDPIGKGRPETCSCLLPRSAECVRCHVAEKRSQLKEELGPAFYEWRFDRMGEEVSQTWTGEEEGIFEAIASQNNPALAKSLWDQTFRIFYTKSRESLISYYFNVFLLRRRSYQNRVTPNHTDSDDEESGFGLLRNGTGYYAIKAGGSNSILYALKLSACCLFACSQYVHSLASHQTLDALLSHISVIFLVGNGSDVVAQGAF